MTTPQTTPRESVLDGDYAVRPLRLADVPALEVVERRCYDTPWSRSMFAGELVKPGGESRGVFNGAGLVAYCVTSRYIDAWHVMNVAVDPEHRRRGLARLLLETLFRETDGDGTRGFTLEARVSNESAIRLYLALGFEAVGIRRAYYTDNREDATIMWRLAPGAELEPSERP